MTYSYTISDSDVHSWIQENFDPLTISSWTDEEYTYHANEAREMLVRHIIDHMIYSDEIERHKPYVSYEETSYNNLYSY